MSDHLEKDKKTTGILPDTRWFRNALDTREGHEVRIVELHILRKIL